MARVLIVDDVALLRSPVALALQRAGYETSEAGSGSEALTLINEMPFDLMFLDLSMPTMGGMEVLRRMRGNPKTAHIPVVLLTATADKAHIVEAAQLGVRDYILKSGFTMKDIVARADKHCRSARVSTMPAKAAARPPVQSAPPEQIAKDTPRVATAAEKEGFMARVLASMNGRTFSGVVASVMNLAASPSVDLSALADLVQQDSLMSVRILQAANSAAYASSHGPFTSIADAIKRIGRGMVRNIAATVGVFEVMPQTASDGFNVIRCWQHSLATARLCERLAPTLPEEERGLAYLIGLCHDLTEILLRSTFSAEYAQILETHASGLPLLQAERAVLGVSRLEVMRVLHKSLQLPPPIAGIIESFHAASAKSRASSDRPLIRVLYMADQLANGMLLATGLESTVTSFTHLDPRAGAFSNQPEPLDAARWREEILALSISLAGMKNDEMARLAVPIIPQKASRIWFCSSTLSTPDDPLPMALENIAHLNRQDRLPTESEVNDYDGVIVLAPRVTDVRFKADELAQISPHRPILWLTSDESTERQPGIEVRTLPVSLGALSDFADTATLSPVTLELVS